MKDCGLVMPHPISDLAGVQNPKYFLPVFPVSRLLIKAEVKRWLIWRFSPSSVGFCKRWEAARRARFATPPAQKVSKTFFFISALKLETSNSIQGAVSGRGRRLHQHHPRQLDPPDGGRDGVGAGRGRAQEGGQDGGSIGKESMQEQRQDRGQKYPPTIALHHLPRSLVPFPKVGI